MLKGTVAPRNKGCTRSLPIGSVTLRTADRHIDLSDEWLYRRQMIELAQEHDVRFVELRADSFRAFARTISIVCNPATTAERLRHFAHECAHIGFRHRTGYPRHRMEFEAETYAYAYLTSQGIAVNPKWIDGGRHYVAKLISMAISRRAKRFDREAWEFADPSLLHPDYREAFARFTPELIDASHDNGFRDAMAAFGQTGNNASLEACGNTLQGSAS